MTCKNEIMFEEIVIRAQLLVFKTACKELIKDEMRIPEYRIFKDLPGKYPFSVSVWLGCEVVRGDERKVFATHGEALYYCWYQQKYDVWSVYDATKLRLSGSTLLHKKHVTLPDLRRLISPAGRSAERQMRRLNKKKHLVKFMGYVLKQEPKWMRKTNG